LGSEVRDQRDLLVGEGADLLPEDTDRPDQLILPEHRHHEKRSTTAEFDRSDHPRHGLKITLSGPGIGDVDDPLRRYEAAERDPWIGRDFIVREVIRPNLGHVSRTDGAKLAS